MTAWSMFLPTPFVRKIGTGASPRNKAWAKTIPVFENPDAWGTDRNCYFVVDQAHTGLWICLSPTSARAVREKEQPQKKTSVLGKLKNRKVPAIETKAKGSVEENHGGRVVSAEFYAQEDQAHRPRDPRGTRKIREKMALIGQQSAAYIRRMAIDGLYVRLNLPELNELISLLRYNKQQYQPDRQAAERDRQSV